MKRKPIRLGHKAKSNHLTSSLLRCVCFHILASMTLRYDIQCHQPDRGHDVAETVPPRANLSQPFMLSSLRLGTARCCNYTRGSLPSPTISVPKHKGIIHAVRNSNGATEHTFHIREANTHP